MVTADDLPVTMEIPVVSPSHDGARRYAAARNSAQIAAPSAWTHHALVQQRASLGGSDLRLLHGGPSNESVPEAVDQLGAGDRSVLDRAEAHERTLAQVQAQRLDVDLLVAPDAIDDHRGFVGLRPAIDEQVGSAQYVLRSAKPRSARNSMSSRFISM